MPPPHLLCGAGVGLDSTVNLLVASLDLELVRLIRGAIRTADLGAAARAGAPAGCLGPAASFEPRRHIHPEPVIEPRRHIHPEPRVEPRRVIHPEPQIEAQLNDAACHAPPPVVVEVRPSCPTWPPRIQPPWKLRPWQIPSAPPPRKPVLKIILRRPDMVPKGSMIDVFI